MRFMRSGQFLGVNQQSRTVAGMVISKTIYRSAVYEGWHAHRNTHITYVLQGGNREERKSSEREAHSGQVIFYHQNELHRNARTRFPTLNLNVELTPACLVENRISEVALCAAIRQHRDAHVQFALLKMYRESMLADDHADASMYMLLHELVSSREKLFSPSARPSWIEKVRQRMHDQWRGRVELDELAHAGGVSPITVSKYFPRYFGCTLGQYMRKLKIGYALDLVRSTDQRLVDIAYVCGFADQSHFTRTFREQTGMLPTQFRDL